MKITLHWSQCLNGGGRWNCTSELWIKFSSGISNTSCSLSNNRKMRLELEPWSDCWNSPTKSDQKHSSTFDTVTSHGQKMTSSLVTAGIPYVMQMPEHYNWDHEEQRWKYKWNISHSTVMQKIMFRKKLFIACALMFCINLSRLTISDKSVYLVYLWKMHVVSSDSVPMFRAIHITVAAQWGLGQPLENMF